MKEKSLLEYLTNSVSILKRLAYTPRFKNLLMLQKNMHPADIMITYLDRSHFKSLPALIANRSLAYFQSNSFTSSKIVAYNKKIIGYGTKQHGKLSFVKFSIWSKKAGGIVLLRYPGLTSKQQKIIVDFMADKIDHPYSTKQLFVSLLKRQIYDKVQSDADIKKFVNKNGLFCSNIIALAYKEAGIDLYFDVRNDLNVWPKDLLMSTDFKVVGLWERNKEKSKN